MLEEKFFAIVIDQTQVIQFVVVLSELPWLTDLEG
jgi:hypothetical protein